MSRHLDENHELRQRVAQAIGERTDPELLRFSHHLSSGYTYIGQFISHDMVPTTDPLRASRFVDGTLGLGSVYDARPPYQLQHIPADDLLFDQQGRFKFAKQSHLDFQRNARGTALVPEQRNDDHVIIAQFHMLMQRLHNMLLNKGFATDAAHAQKLLTLTFQMVVLEDYLKEILNTQIYQEVICKDRDLLPDETFWTDVFRFATFRFGHSTVRNTYSLRIAEDDPLSQKDLTDLFMASRSKRGINADDLIDWRVFFCLAGEDQFEGLMPIDTRISGFLADIPMGQGIGIHIAAKNLESELAANLPNGIEVAKMVAEKLPKSIHHDFRLLETSDIEDAAFNNMGLEIKDLTIWLYILLEAQFSAPHRLGITASCVNAQVIKYAIRKARTSVYMHGKYDFDTLTKAMGDWGGVLNSFAEQNRHSETGNINMKDLVNFLSNNE